MLSFVCGWWSFRVNIGLSLATHLCSDRFYYNSAKYAKPGTVALQEKKNPKHLQTLENVFVFQVPF